MQKKNDGEQKYISISECNICKNIPQKATAIEEKQQQLPIAVKELINIISYLKKCPLCGTYYLYQFNYERGELFIPDENEHTIIRCSPIRATKLFLAPGVTEKDRELLQKEYKKLNERYDSIIEYLILVLKNKYNELNWHIKKYIIEVLTDDYIFKKDWNKISETLLKHPDPVVRVETALDILIVATEKFAVWSVRDFSMELQKVTKELLFLGNGENSKELINVFNEVFLEKGETLILDAIFGYETVSIEYNAFRGLNKALFNNIDITPAISKIINWLFAEEDWRRKRAYNILIDYIKKKEENKKLVLDQINNYKINENYNEVKEIIKKCKYEPVRKLKPKKSKKSKKQL